jgi:hypothetical protein
MPKILNKARSMSRVLSAKSSSPDVKQELGEDFSSVI